MALIKNLKAESNGTSKHVFGKLLMPCYKLIGAELIWKLSLRIYCSSKSALTSMMVIYMSAASMFAAFARLVRVEKSTASAAITS